MLSGADGDLTKRVQRLEVNAAWKNMREGEGLNEKVFETGTFADANLVLDRNYSVVQNMARARKLCWMGCQGLWEAHASVSQELVKEMETPKFNTTA